MNLDSSGCWCISVGSLKFLDLHPSFVSPMRKIIRNPCSWLCVVRGLQQRSNVVGRTFAVFRMDATKHLLSLISKIIPRWLSHITFNQYCLHANSDQPRLDCWCVNGEPVPSKRLLGWLTSCRPLPLGCRCWNFSQVKVHLKFSSSNQAPTLALDTMTMAIWQFPEKQFTGNSRNLKNSINKCLTIFCPG